MVTQRRIKKIQRDRSYLEKNEYTKLLAQLQSFLLSKISARRALPSMHFTDNSSNVGIDHVVQALPCCEWNVIT